MRTNTRSSKRGGRRGRQRPAWPEAEDEAMSTELLPGTARAGADNDELRQMVARRRLEQYLESKRLRELVQEIFYDEER